MFLKVPWALKYEVSYKILMQNEFEQFWIKQTKPKQADPMPLKAEYCLLNKINRQLKARKSWDFSIGGINS